MTYRVDRSLGYQRWGVTNPWIFADLSQPQRQRGSVSPMVYMTNPPALVHPHLGQTDQSVERERLQDARAERMEKIAIAGVTLSVLSLLMVAHSSGLMKKLMPNGRRRRRARR